MKKLLTIATLIVATLSTNAFAAKPTSGNAEFKGKVAKVCEVGEFKDNSTTSLTGKNVTIANIGTNDVSLDVTITDKKKNSMLPAGQYTIIVPVTCTK